MSSWFGSWFGGQKETTTTPLRDSEREDRENAMDMTRNQISATTKSQVAIDAALTQFRDCLEAFQQKKKFLHQQRQLYLTTLRAMDKEDGFTSSEDEEEKEDPVLERYIESISDSEDEQLYPLSSDGNNNDESQMEMIDIDDLGNLVQIEDDEGLDELPKIDLSKIKENRKRNENKTDKQIEKEMEKRKTLKKALKEEIPQLLNKIDHRMLYYKTQIEILQDRRDQMEKSNLEAQKRLEDANSKIAEMNPTV